MTRYKVWGIGFVVCDKANDKVYHQDLDEI